MTLDQYEQHRRWWEAGLWTAFFLVNWLAGTWVVWLEFQREGSTTPLWQPLLWEGSSNLTQLLLLPLVLAWDRRFPLEPGQLRRHAAVHAALSLVFSVVHVVSMVAIRKAVYALHGSSY